MLVVFLFLGTVTFFYLAARTLATHNAWRTVVKRGEADLERLSAETKVVDEGGPPNDEGVPDPKGIHQLRQELQKLALDRGGVLYDVALDEVKDGVLQLTLKGPDHGLVPGSIVFGFSAAPLQEGGRYLGEFKVTAVGDDATKVQIAPNLPLTQAQSQRLAAATGPLTLYVTMPIDDAAVFANLDEPARQNLLPAASQAEYSQADRKLRDYEQMFHEHYVQVSLLNDAINKLNDNIARIGAATAEAEKEIGYRQTEKTNLASDLQNFERERDAIAQYQVSLIKAYQQVREALKSTYLANRAMAADLTTAQFEAADEIDRRSGAAATPPAGSATRP